MSRWNLLRVITDIRRQFNSPPKQLARVLGITVQDVINESVG